MLTLDWSMPLNLSAVIEPQAVFLESARQFVIESAPGQLDVIDLDRGRLIRSIKHDSLERVNVLLPADKDRKLVCVSARHGIIVCALDDDRIMPLIGRADAHGFYRRCAMLPDGRTLVVGQANQDVAVWDVSRNRELRMLHPPPHEPCSTTKILNFHVSPLAPDRVLANYEGSGDKLPYISSDELGYSRMAMFSVSEGRLLWDRCCSTEIRRVIFMQDGTQVWGSSDMPVLEIIHGETGELVQEIEGYWELSGWFPDEQQILAVHARTHRFHLLQFPSFERIADVDVPTKFYWATRAEFPYLLAPNTLALWSLHEGRAVDQITLSSKAIDGWQSAALGCGIILTDDGSISRITFSDPSGLSHQIFE